MTRLPVAESALPPRPHPYGLAVACACAGLVGVGVAAIADAVALAVAAGVAAVAAVVVFHVRGRVRQGQVDLFLLRLSGLLGWPAPERAHVVASRWRGGWVGHPARLKIRYNPVGDESAPEVVMESRRLAQRAFGVPFKTAAHKKAVITLVQAPPAAPGEDDRQAQIERVSTVITKTFGASSHTSTKFDDGKLKEISVQYEVTPRLSSAALRGRIEASVSAVLDGRWRAFWDLQHDTVRMEVRPELPAVVPNPNVAPATVDPLATYDDLVVPIGCDEDGNVIGWRPKHDPHGLVTGKTGKGKTVCLLGIVEFLAAHGWDIWGIDGKRIELLGLRDWPNVRLIAGRIDHQARVGHEVYRIMQQRFADYEAGKVRLEDFTPVLFVIDEYKTFRNAVTRWFRTVKPKGPGSQAPVLEEISDFVSLARKVRMHLVIGLQRPDAEFLTGDMRDNFNFRVSFGRLSPDGAKMMWDSYSTGVTIPVSARGRGTAYNKQGRPVEIQGYWTPDPYQTVPDKPDMWVFDGDLQLVKNLQPTVRLHELMAIVDPSPTPDLDGDGKTDPLNYLDYMDAKIVPAGQAPHLIRKAAGIFTSTENDPEHAREAALDKLQHDAAEPEISDEDELFAGYSPAVDTPVEGLLDDSGELAADGVLALISPDTGTWGLIDSAELDLEDDGYVTLGYRDYETGEPGSISLPADDVLITRHPDGAGR